MVQKKKKQMVTAVTPIGFFSFPWLHTPDEGRENASGKYSLDLFVSREQMQSEAGKTLRKKTIQVAQSFFKDPDISKLSEFKNVIQDVEKLDKDKRKALPEAVQEGFFRLRARRSPKLNAPLVLDASKEELAEADIKAIKGGDVGRMLVAIYGYSQQGGGIAYGLNIAQFIKKGKAFGQGNAASLAMLDEIEVPADDLDDDEESEDDTDDNDEAQPKRKKSASKFNKRDAEEDDEDDSAADSDEDEEEEEDRPSRLKKKKSRRDEEEDDDEDF